MTYTEQINELLDQRSGLLAQARAENDKGNQEGFSKAMADLDAIDQKIGRLEKLRSTETRSTSVNTSTEAETRVILADVERRSKAEYETEFNERLFNQSVSVPVERRAMQLGFDQNAGFLAAPAAVEMDIVRNLSDSVRMLSICRISDLPRGVQQLKLLRRTAKMGSSGWVGELTAGSQVDSLRFAPMTLTLNSLGSYAAISNDLFTFASQGFNPMTLVQDEIMEDAQLDLEDAFLYGAGPNKPAGLMVNSSITSVNTGSGTTLTSDGLYNVMYDLRGDYARRGTWLLHRTGIREVVKLKDDESRYLWQPSLQAGQPDLLLGRPVVEAERLPTYSTWTTDVKVGAFGDFSHYRIARQRTPEFKSDGSILVLSNQTIVIMRLWYDGQVTKPEAFRLINIHA